MGGGGSHIHGVLPLGDEDGALSDSGVSIHSAQFWMAFGALSSPALSFQGGVIPGER